MRTLIVALLLISPAFAQKVVLTYTASTTNSATCPVTEYRIYRADVSNGEVLAGAGTSTTLIAKVPAPMLTYTDSTVQYGHSYFYKATAWGAACTSESVFSNENIDVIPKQIIIITAPGSVSGMVVIP